MNIGIFDPYLDDLGGGEKYMMSIAECLAKDHKVSVFWDDEKDFETLKRRFLLDLPIELTRNIFSSKVNLFERLKSTKKYDAIFILSDGSIPLVASEKLFIHFQQPMLHLNSVSTKTKLKLKRVNLVFCNSKFTKSFIDKTFGINSSVIYPPISLYPKETSRENIILNVGRLRVKTVGTDEYKKQSFMIDTFKKMANDGLNNWKFILAVSAREEDKKYLENLKKRARGFPIKFIVNKNNRELWDLYNKAKIYWHASGFNENLIKHPEYAEHFGISTVEAMGAGAVPVVINAGGQKEIVENGENGFLWSTESEFLQRTAELIQDQNLQKKMSQRARKRAAFFAGDRFCQEIKELIKE